MYRIFYAEKDTTLYERNPDRNTGIDEIIELWKIASGSRENGIIQANTYNSRILIDFGTEVTNLKNAITAGDVPTLHNQNITSASVFLNLHASDATDLLRSYEIKAYPVSESWDNGNGTYKDTPESKIGASWNYRSGDAIAQNTTGWGTGSAASAGTSQGTSVLKGGGTWITGSGYEASQSFTNESPDLRMDVTNIVRQWVDGNITNNGFMIKLPYADEIDGKVRGSIKYFGRESHTIFVPRLEVCWDDSSTSESDTVIASTTYVPYFKNIKPEYRTSDIARFFIGVRPEFPTKSYTTSSFYKTGEVLPLSSSYEIIDSVTNDIIIKDETTYVTSKTKISNDGNGSYFDLRMDSFMPERYYKIKLTCRRTNDTQTFDDFYFKVVN